jgi:bifunctional non-homologous end joining protein LigD
MRFMLAERGTPADLDKLAGRGWLFDLKIDGIRALVTIAHGEPSAPVVTMTSRNGLDLTDRYPELLAVLRGAAASGAAPDGDVRRAVPAELVLDAEIAVPGPDGLPSWPLTHRRTAQRSSRRSAEVDVSAVLYVFDVLSRNGRDLRSAPLRERRAVLEQVSAGWPTLMSVIPSSEDAEAMWDFVRAHHLEGVIAKDPQSRYVAGRSRSWVKIKATQTLSCLVGGVEWAPDVPDEPRSLQLFLVDAEGSLVPVGKASAGVSPALRPALLDGLRNPPLIVEVEYTQVTPGGVLRNPVVRAVRTDLDVLGCSVEQLAWLG